jgi:uncharacterized protein YqgC (DUF456 family)
MTSAADILQSIGMGLGVAGIVLLCLAGLVLSCLTISGTWLVVGATILAALLRPGGFPGWWTVAAFVLVSAFVEAIEALAGIWGVRKRGGSHLAGLAAFAGGILGVFLGSLIPIPVLGQLLGMLVGSFALTFAVEAYRLKKAEHAAHIAWGTVLARVAVLLMKVVVTLGMIVVLAGGAILNP